MRFLDECNSGPSSHFPGYSVRSLEVCDTPLRRCDCHCGRKCASHSSNPVISMVTDNDTPVSGLRQGSASGLTALRSTCCGVGQDLSTTYELFVGNTTTVGSNVFDCVEVARQPRFTCERGARARSCPKDFFPVQTSARICKLMSWHGHVPRDREAHDEGVYSVWLHA